MSAQLPVRRTLIAAATIVAMAAISIGMFALFGRTVVAGPSSQPQAAPVSVATVLASDVSGASS